MCNDFDLGPDGITMTENNLPKCYFCKHFCIADFGYSDYTVEGSMVECLKENFESREKATDYGEETEKEITEEKGYLDHAADKCGDFTPGEYLVLNVNCNREVRVVNHYFPGLKEENENGY